MGRISHWVAAVAAIGVAEPGSCWWVCDGGMVPPGRCCVRSYAAAPTAAVVECVMAFEALLQATWMIGCHTQLAAAIAAARAATQLCSSRRLAC